MRYFSKAMLVASAALCLNLSAYSQDISLKINNVTVKEAMERVKKDTGYSFVFSSKDVNTSKRISVSVSDASIEEVIKQILKGQQGLDYEIQGKKIVLRKAQPVSNNGNQEKRTVSGKVVDAKGEPVIGATIMEKGTTNGTITDFDGNFNLNVVDGAQLEVSYVGFQSQNVKVIYGKSIAVTLKEDSELLDEVVVVGYGTTRKSDLISSVVSVKADDIRNKPTFNVAEMLRGQAAGVRISLNSAAPGGDSSIEIRGKRSISAGNDPIYIVDGVQVSSLNEISPSDIKSIEILKDAAAQSIYGARASNGVVLITTQRGDTGKISVSYNGFYGIQTIKRNFDVFSGEEYAQLKREADRTNYQLDGYRDDDLIFNSTELEVLQSGNFVDWTKEVLETGLIQNHSINLTGGTEKTKLYASANFQKQKGVMPNTDFLKGALRVNLDQQITKWLKMGINFSYSGDSKNDPNVSSVLQKVVTTSPLSKIYDEEGNLKIYPNDLQENSNPLLDVNEISNKVSNQRTLVNIFFDTEIFKDLKYRLNISRRSNNSKYLGYNSSKSSVGLYAGGGTGEVGYQDFSEWQMENILNYSLNKKNHNLLLTAVQSINSSRSSGLSNSVKSFPNDILGIYGLSSADSCIPKLDYSKRTLASFAGRFQYNFDNRYYVTGAIRADGSSVFGINNKWGIFPSIALGWNIYQEKFMKNLNFIDNLKLRISYGSVGNEGISPYGSLSYASQRDYIINDSKVAGYIPGTMLANPKLKWETSTTLNMALDFSFFSKLYGTIELYDTRTTDLLVNRTLNSMIGYSYMRDNIGEIQNKGIELSLNYRAIENSNVGLNAGITFSKNINKILHLYGYDENGDGIEDDDLGNRWFIGHPINVFYMYEYDGIWQMDDDIANSAQPNAKPGDIKLLDVDNNKIIGEEDKTIRSKEPDWIGSFNFDFRYRNFDLSFDISTVQGILKDNPYLYDGVYGGDLRGVFNGMKVDYWTPENTDAVFPRPNPKSQVYGYVLGIQDASYVRLNNITLGYSFSKNILSNLRLNKVRIYLTGQNLLTITKYKSYSPEKAPNEYPEAITVAAGLQINF